MKKQNLTPKQYQRTNKVMCIICALCYLIFVVIEMNSRHGAMNALAIARCALYIGMIVMNVVVVKLIGEKKTAMLTLAYAYLLTYIVLAFCNGAGALVMALPAIFGFMMYLNSTLVMSGCVSAFVITVIKSAMFKSAGDMVAFNFANLTTMAYLVSIIVSFRAISLLIEFSKEDKEVLEKEAVHRKEVAETVSGIVEDMDVDFHNVLDALGGINESMDSARLSMDEIARSSENTTEAINHQADMTGQIQERLESTNETAAGAKEITEKLSDIVENGKQLADDLKEQSVLVDQNTARISETVNMLVENVQQVSSITDAILKNFFPDEFTCFECEY